MYEIFGTSCNSQWAICLCVVYGGGKMKDFSLSIVTCQFNSNLKSCNGKNYKRLQEETKSNSSSFEEQIS